MSLNWTVMGYIGFGSTGGTGSGNTIVIVNENGLTPVQEVTFELETVSADINMDIDNLVVVYTVPSEFTLFLEEES